MNENDVLRALRINEPFKLADLPSSSSLYALHNHAGDIRYIGIAHSEGFRTRIRNKHSTGSEDRSHKFSCAYNAGRLWRDRHNGDPGDGSVSKRLRNRFILKHCRATVFPIPDYDEKIELVELERRAIALAEQGETLWNRIFIPEREPTDLVDQLILELRLGPTELAALARQNSRYTERQI